MKYIKPYKKYFILGPLCMITEVICDVTLPKYLAMIINNAADRTPLYSIGVAAMMILTAVVMLAAGVGAAYFGTKASVFFAADLRNDIYQKVQDFSSSNMDKFGTGSLVTRLTNDVDQIRSFINMLLRMCLRAPGLMIGSLIMAITLRPSLSLVMAVSLPLLALFIAFMLYLGFPKFTVMQEKLDALNGVVQENVTNIRVVKSFVREDREISKFGKANKNMKKAGMGAMGLMIAVSPVMNLCMNLTIAAVIWFGSKMVLADTGAMPIGDLSAFITYCNQIMMALMMVAMIFVMFSRAEASGKRIKEVLSEDIDISDEDAKSKDKTIKDGEVEFRNVSFRYYKNSQEKILDNINIRIAKGSTVGIIGSTGSGKTTLVSMIPRLYDPDEGQVLVDGVDVRDYSLKNLRDGIGMVLQNNVLFSGTVEENIRWGQMDAGDEEIKKAAEYAQADKFINEFSKGYDTIIEQGGVNVSGGQKQRLCIARALIKKPKILILDDSTSAVDTATEAMIRRSFKNELKDSTKIIISQRIQSVMDTDEILVVNEGRISNHGTHDQLMKCCEEYREIYNSQMENASEKGE